MKEINMEQFLPLLAQEDVNLLDVREESEFACDHLPQAKNYPLSTLTQWAPSLNKEKTYYFICRSGARSGRAALYFASQGYTAINVLGGMLAYHEQKIENELEVL